MNECMRLLGLVSRHNNFQTFKLSNVILRHSYFPHTSTFSAFEVSY